MQRKYNKKVLGHVSLEIDGREITCFYTKDKDYFNIHVLDPKYKDDEMNTLKLQEPIGYEPSDNFLYGQLWEHVIWDKMYSINESLYTASVEIEGEKLDY